MLRKFKPFIAAAFVPFLLTRCTLLRDVRAASFSQRDQEAPRGMLSEKFHGCESRADNFEKTGTQPLESRYLKVGRQGPNYELDPWVEADGFNYYFRIHSSFGEIDAYGTPELALRLSEIPALAQLDNVDSSGRFVRSVADVTTESYRRSWHMLKNPVATAIALPGALARFFESAAGKTENLVVRIREFYRGGTDGAAGEQLDEPGEPSQTAVKGFERQEVLNEAVEFADQFSDEYVGYAGAKRRLARELNVDPFSRNRILQRELMRVSAIDLTASVTSTFIPRVPFSGYLSRIDRFVSEHDEKEIVKESYRSLRELGLSPDTSKRLLSNQAYSRTEVTEMVAILRKLKNLDGIVDAADLASRATSPPVASLYLGSLKLIAESRRHAFSRLATDTGMIEAETKQGAAVIPFPVDRLMWTGPLACYLRNLQGRNQPVTLFVRGSASKRLRKQVSEWGWHVIELHQWG